MSRGDRVVASGNISSSMRVNYENGVDEYYRKVGTTYRNPHFPGVQLCIFSWLSMWWEMEQTHTSVNPITIFDMACGSGEATVSVKQWWATGRQNYDKSVGSSSQHSVGRPIHKSSKFIIPSLSPNIPNPQILAADPYTSAAYIDRTCLPCASLSFRDIAEGLLPPSETNLADQVSQSASPFIDMVICSFALHLVGNPSELFALLWELSMKSRWLLLISPHKKPEIKDGWGWVKWDVESWKECRMSNHKGELLKDRVHCRIYRSVNV